MALLALSPAQRPSQLGSVEGGVADVLVMVVHHAAGVEGDQNAACALDGFERPIEDALRLQQSMKRTQKAWESACFTLVPDTSHYACEGT